MTDRLFKNLPTFSGTLYLLTSDHWRYAGLFLQMFTIRGPWSYPQRIIWYSSDSCLLHPFLNWRKLQTSNIKSKDNGKRSLGLGLRPPKWGLKRGHKTPWVIGPSTRAMVLRWLSMLVGLLFFNATPFNCWIKSC